MHFILPDGGGMALGCIITGFGVYCGGGSGVGGGGGWLNEYCVDSACG